MHDYSLILVQSKRVAIEFASAIISSSSSTSTGINTPSSYSITKRPIRILSREYNAEIIAS